jgi:hypothetical protein
MTSASKQVSESLTYLQNVPNDITKLYKDKYDARPSYERWSYTALDIIWIVGALAVSIGSRVAGFSIWRSIVITTISALTFHSIAEKIKNAWLGRKGPDDEFKKNIKLVQDFFSLTKEQVYSSNASFNSLVSADAGFAVEGKLNTNAMINIQDIKNRKWTIKDDLQENVQKHCKLVDISILAVSLLRFVVKNDNNGCYYSFEKIKRITDAKQNDVSAKIFVVMKALSKDFEKTQSEIKKQLEGMERDKSAISCFDALDTNAITAAVNQ